jgi:hypothetical protein
MQNKRTLRNKENIGNQLNYEYKETSFIKKALNFHIVNFISLKPFRWNELFIKCQKVLLVEMDLSTREPMLVFSF